MNQIAILHILRHLVMIPVLMLIMALAFAGCSDDSEPRDPSVDEGAEGNYFVNIHITTGTHSATRSILTEEEGTKIESSIGLDDLSILVFDENQVLKDIWYRSGNPIGNVQLQFHNNGYVVSSWMEKGKYDESMPFSVVVLANWSSHEESSPLDLRIGVTRYDDLAERSFLINHGDLSEAWMPTEDSLIPMFGVLYTSLSNYSNKVYNRNNPMMLGTVNMLRAVAKIEIIDLASTPDVKITSVKLNARNGRGLLTPEIFDYHNTHQVTAANIPADPMTTTASLPFRKNGNKYEAYIPEMKLGATLAERNCIDVDIFYHDYHETRKIALVPYNSAGRPEMPPSGKLPDEWKALLRNHIYRFTISTIPTDPNLELTVDVQPFSSVNLLPQLGLERTDDGYIVVRDREGNIIKYIRPNGMVLTFEVDNRWPYLGTFMGVFDGSKRVLVGYFEDGRSIIFNYNSDEYNPNDVYEHLESWEIYSKPTLKYADGKTIPEHLEETFFFKDYANDGTTGGIIRKAYTHIILDDKGRVIEEYLYPSLEDFWNHYNKEESHEVCERIKLADYTGSRYGDKVVKYYDQSGNVTCTLRVTGNNETYE